jgi:glycerol dehydrogenase
MSLRVFGAPHRYIQGPGALDRLGAVLAPFGPAPLIIADRVVLEMLDARLRAGLAAEGLAPQILPFDGEITYAALQALAEAAEGAPGIVAGLGGGKALDAAKGVAMRLGAAVATVPTIASNDSPTSGALAVYDADHVMVSVDRMARSPEAVIVDTALIAAAPAAFLRAGIGDAITKKFEAEGCAAGSGLTPFGTRPLLTALAIADRCYATLRAHGAAALRACAAGQVTEDLEATVEACVLMSGLGFENGGLSLAHSMTRGLVRARGAKAAIHGDQVAYALLVQWALEGREAAALTDLTGFYHEIGLPCCLADLGMEAPGKAEIRGIAEATMTAPHLANLGTPVDVPALVAAMEQIEARAGVPA